ncbi:unnamed protein product [Protopolystoma xenopodis]|uniref:Secreted protein n=1 Tax=Protopolystoma xenopodis TaxID=117903 RepID=A0A448X0U3_9PLAT|nr:unnamed protein product [Protopolystoma xenopodis]
MLQSVIARLLTRTTLSLSFSSHTPCWWWDGQNELDAAFHQTPLASFAAVGGGLAGFGYFSPRDASVSPSVVLLGAARMKAFLARLPPALPVCPCASILLRSGWLYVCRLVCPSARRSVHLIASGLRRDLLLSHFAHHTFGKAA